MLKWNSAKKPPKITKRYFVRRKMQEVTPTIAVYEHTKKNWLVAINGCYWVITGVYEWAEIDMPLAKRK